MIDGLVSSMMQTSPILSNLFFSFELGIFSQYELLLSAQIKICDAIALCVMMCYVCYMVMF